MPPMAPYVVLDWLADDSALVTFDCLLPTGIIVPLEFDRELTVAEIKTVRHTTFLFLIVCKSCA